MPPSAKIIADSISEDGYRLTTMQVRCHRFVLAEFNTHRVFSRNSASSRAIPVEKQLVMIQDDPAVPLEWRAEQPGMQGGEVLEGSDADAAAEFWFTCLYAAVFNVNVYLDETPKEKRVHKSIINRVLEPFMWHTICVSSTEWQNFFRQRCSPLAQPEIRVVAEEMENALAESIPTVMADGTWHLPYVDDAAYDEALRDGVDLKAVSAARCARTSYLTQEGVRDLAKDVELYERLCNPGEGPEHASPLEHVATPDTESRLGNFDGWRQLRHEIFPPK